MPAPRILSCLPDWIPAGIFTSCTVLSSPGISISPPSAAVVKLTGQRANKVVPSRWKTEWRFRWTKM
jgi:hypothetical protein